MKLLVTGSRDYTNRMRVRSVLINAKVFALAVGEDFTVIVGDCPDGADLFTRQWCDDYNVTPIVGVADWDACGIYAGPLRNQWMVDTHRPDYCVAFFQAGAGNRGTTGCSDYAESKGVKVHRLYG